VAIRVLIIHGEARKANALEDVFNADKMSSVKGVYRKSSDAYSYLMGADINLVVLSEQLDTMSGYEFITKLMKSKPVACLLISDPTINIEIDYPRALDYSIVDTFSTEFKDDGFMFSSRLLIKAKILTKLNISRFQTQIDQINNYKPPKIEPYHGEVVDPEKLESKVSEAEKMKQLRDRTSIRKIRQNQPTELNIHPSRRYDSLVVLGASTGGPRLLVYIVSQLPRNFPPVIIVQHMPKGFVAQFAQRMNDNAQINVKRAEDGDLVLAGNVYIAPGGYHLELDRSGSETYIRITDGPKVNFVKPAVDITLFSAARTHANKVISVILTGMGSDGREGSRIIKNQGGKVIALNEEDSVIYGMNKAVVEAGLADAVEGMDGIVNRIVSFLT